MGLVKTRRLAAMRPPSPRLRRIGKQQRAIHLRQGYGGLKARLKPAAKCGEGAARPIGCRGRDRRDGATRERADEAQVQMRW